MIVITLPHGKANQSTHYDVGALDFIQYLERAMTDMNINYEVLVGDSHRELVDLNRKNAYGTEYYNELCGLLEKASFHLDLHSYPFVREDAPEEEALTSLGDDLRAWSVHTAVFLDVDNVTNPIILRDLTNKIEQRFDIGIFDVSIEGAYLSTVASVLFNLPSILMEVNDQSSEDYEELANYLAAWFVDFS